eukprot:scaffold84191_cov74-Cyclotella_meneghiniana.AAC.2
MRLKPKSKPKNSLFDDSDTACTIPSNRCDGSMVVDSLYRGVLDSSCISEYGKYYQFDWCTIDPRRFNLSACINSVFLPPWKHHHNISSPFKTGLVNIITLLLLYFTDTASVSHRARRPNRRVYGDGVHDVGVMYRTRRPRSSSD